MKDGDDDVITGSGGTIKTDGVVVIRQPSRSREI
jgi:hypothetical protein